MIVQQYEQLPHAKKKKLVSILGVPESFQSFEMRDYVRGYKMFIKNLKDLYKLLMEQKYSSSSIPAKPTKKKARYSVPGPVPQDAMFKNQDILSNIFQYMDIRQAMKKGLLSTSTSMYRSLLSSLQTFHLNGHTYDFDEENDIRLLKSLLPMFTHIKTLEIGNIDMTDKGFQSLVPELRGLTHLKKLNISGNFITDKGACVLARLLPSFPRLEHLYLSFNEIKNKGIKAILSAVVHIPKLKTLHIQDNTFDLLGLDDVLALLPSLTHLQDLAINVRSVILDPKRVDTLASCLLHFPNLQSLSLWGTTFLPEGIKRLVKIKILPQLTRLKVLHLGSTRMGNEGVIELVNHVLPTLHTLHTLDLSQNEIGDEGLKALASVLPHMTSLKRLQLQGNDFGNDGIKTLFKQLNKTHVQFVNIKYNQNNPHHEVDPKLIHAVKRKNLRVMM
jgi:Ran GTPase-activating protein (RanGAP) involved in mRNA processing and transport